MLHAFSPQELNNVLVDLYKRSGLLEYKPQGLVAQAACRRERKEKDDILDKKVFKAIKTQILKNIFQTIIRQNTELLFVLIKKKKKNLLLCRPYSNKTGLKVPTIKRGTLAI